MPAGKTVKHTPAERKAIIWYMELNGDKKGAAWAKLLDSVLTSCEILNEHGVAGTKLAADNVAVAIITAAKEMGIEIPKKDPPECEEESHGD